jgi:hypothetical protein
MAMQGTGLRVALTPHMIVVLAVVASTQEAHDVHNAEPGPILAETVFQADFGVRYKDANGNVTGNSPWRLID